MLAVYLNQRAGTIVADASNDKKQKGKQAIRVRLGDNGCKALWGRRFTSERWRLFRGNRVARTVKEQKGRAADGRPEEARGSLAGSISSRKPIKTGQ